MSSSAPAITNARYAHIDAMRAVAVLIVVVAHAGLGAVVPGGAGVTVFFAISGFIITHLLLREQERTGGFDLGGFYVRRAFKIVPPFVIAILVPTSVYALTGGTVDGAQVLAQVLFVANWLYAFEVPDVTLPGSRVVWSLAIEEQFYIVFALVWIIVVARRHWDKALIWIALTAVVVPIALRAWFFLSQGTVASDRVYAGTDTRMDAIAIGMLSAIFYRRVRMGIAPQGLIKFLAWPGIPFVAAGLFVVTLLYRDPGFRMVPLYALQASLTAIVLLNGLLLPPGRFHTTYTRVTGWRPLQWVGLSSYSIYLVHAPLFKALDPLVQAMPRGASILLLVAVGVGLGVALWFFVEKPVERLKRLWTTRSTRTLEKHK